MFIDPDGMSPSTIVDENGNVVGGSTTDGDLGVYKVSGVTKENFDQSKIDTYQRNGTRIGATLSMESFVVPETGVLTGKVNFNKEAKLNLGSATKTFGDYLKSHSGSEGFDFYKANAGNSGSLDIKSWGFEEATGTTWENASTSKRIDYVYQASYADDNTIMTRRDQGNFFAGRAMKMSGTSEAVMMAGFGAYQSNSNKTGFAFTLMVVVNYLERAIMSSSISGTPLSGMNVTPLYSDSKVSQDLQLKGYHQFQR